MPCPNCSASLQSIGRLESGEILEWCKCCGTLRRRVLVMDDDYGNTDEAPRIVEQSRRVCAALSKHTAIYRLARSAGLYESCFTHEERKANGYGK